METISISLQNFESEVMAASEAAPVVLYFNSARYPECAGMLSSLENLRDELSFKLCAVDLDDRENSPFIQYFQIRGLPDTRVISKGEIADIIEGVTDEKTLKEKLSQYFMSPEDKKRAALSEAIDNGDFETAYSILNELLLLRPEDKKLKLEQIKLLLSMGDTEKAKEYLNQFSPSDEEYPEAENYAKLLNFFAEAAAKTPTDPLELLYHEACVLAARKEYAKALAKFLQIIQTDKHWSNDKAHEAMLALFGVLGKKHELTWEYRAKLNTIWFI